MDPLSQLPPECLYIIIDLLSRQHIINPTGYGSYSEYTRRSLAALARTNKLLSSITLPFLYSDPYYWAPDRFLPSEAQATRNGFRLTRMLLRQPKVVAAAVDADRGELPEYLSMALAYSEKYIEPDPCESYSSDDDGGPYWNFWDDGFDDDDASEEDIPKEKTEEMSATKPASPLLPTDYMCHIRHLNIEKWAIDMERIWPEYDSDYDYGEYLYQRGCEELQGLYVLADRREIYHDLLHREATWALARPILGQLQSFSIPIADIRRYLDVVYDLAGLEKVRFLMDDLTACPGDLKAQKKFTVDRYKEKLLNFAVEFVKNHEHSFPGRLRTATLSDGNFWKNTHGNLRKDTQLEILRIIPPPAGITTLTMEFFPEIRAHPLSFDVSRVTSIFLAVPVPEDLIDDFTRILQRCRSLTLLWMPMPGKGRFSWAAEERRRIDGIRGDTIGITDSRQDTPVHGMVPLAEVTLQAASEPWLTDELDDIAFAFSETLERATVFNSLHCRSLPSNQTSVGRGWAVLPRLTDLTILACAMGLRVDPLLFNYCPNITRMELRGRIPTYRHQDIVPCYPAHLDKIHCLRLTGWPAITFNLETLHSTKQLDELELAMGMSISDDDSIPPSPNHHEDDDTGATSATIATTATTDESSTTTLPPPLIIRSHWTWDWHLPQLTKLALEGEIAYQFQFRMLLSAQFCAI